MGISIQRAIPFKIMLKSSLLSLKSFAAAVKKGHCAAVYDLSTEFFYNWNRNNRLTALVRGILSSANVSYFLRLQSSFL